MIENKNFVHLHLHSMYSILDGVGAPEQYAQYASGLGFKSLAISETETPDQEKTKVKREKLNDE